MLAKVWKVGGGWLMECSLGLFTLSIEHLVSLHISPCSSRLLPSPLMLFTAIMSDPFDTINALEETHYQQGYADGHAHGALHGLYEGRELGQEKCFEWWEELGFFEGQAQLWRRLANVQGGTDKKISPRCVTILDSVQAQS